MYGIILLRVLFRGDAMTLDELDRQVSECTLCNSLVEKFPASKTVFLGKNNKFDSVKLKNQCVAKGTH